MSDSPREVFRFSTFEFDVRSGELRKAGVRVALQEHSRRLLSHLLQRPNELVTRDDLRQQLWPADTFVDFEHGLNTAIKRLRDALGDDAETPRFIETLPKRGYRLIAQVERLPETSTPPPTATAGWSRLALLVVIGAAALAALLKLNGGSSPPNSASTHLLASIAPAERVLSAHPMDAVQALGLGLPSRRAIALSPDGRLLVFSARDGDRQQLYLRPLDRAAATAIDGTAGGDSPFFSPDGNWIGFWAGGKLRKVVVKGGPVVEICAVPEEHGLLGASWGSDEAIVFATVRGGLWEVGANGGTPTKLTLLEDDEVSHRLPHVLPDASAVVFTAVRRSLNWSDVSIDVYIRRSGERRQLIEGGTDAQYAASGHLLYVRDGVLMAAPFHPLRRGVGAPVAVLKDVLHATYAGNLGLATGAAQVAISDTGTLAFVSGGTYRSVRLQPVWVSRAGSATPISVPPGDYTAVRLSPDGSRMAFMARSGSAPRDIWIHDLSGGPRERRTFEGTNIFPVWTADGARLTFSRAVRGEPNIFWMPADGSGTAERLTSGSGEQFPADWTPGGNRLIFVQRGVRTDLDIWTLARSGDEWRASPVVQSPFSDREPAISPDGRWLAYASDESGVFQIYVQPFPGPGPKRQITIDGGIEPLWARDGRTLFYIEATSDRQHRMMEVSWGTGANPGKPNPLFDASAYLTSTPVRGYDVAADGRFLMLRVEGRAPVQPVTHINVVLNWFADLRSKVSPDSLQSSR